MRACWVDQGQEPEFDALARHKMTAAFFAITDPAVAQNVALTRSRGLTAGVYTAWNWWPTHAGSKLADHMAALTAGIPAGTFLKVQFDIEAHDPVYILDCLRRWRALRPKQDTSWTLEGFQGGWMTPEFVAEIVKLKVRVVPQGYNGAMTEVWDSLAMARDLTKRGFPDALISPFYDAAKLPGNGIWDGFCFIQGRLP